MHACVQFIPSTVYICTFILFYYKENHLAINTATLEAGQIVFQTVTTDEITFAYGRDDEFTGTILYTATYSPADGTLDHNEAERTGSLADLVPGTQYTVTVTISREDSDTTSNSESTRTCKFSVDIGQILKGGKFSGASKKYFVGGMIRIHF